MSTKLSFQQKTVLNDIINQGTVESFLGFVESMPSINGDLGAGASLLHWLAESSRTDLIKVVLERGGDPNREDIGGITPLEIATYEGNLEAAEMLLKAGANPLHRAEQGMSAKHLAIQLNQTQVIELLNQYYPQNQ